MRVAQQYFNPPKQAETWSLAGFEISVNSVSLHNSFRYRFRDRYRPAPDCLAIFLNEAASDNRTSLSVRMLPCNVFQTGLRERSRRCRARPYARRDKSMYILSIHVIRRPLLIPVFAFSAPLRESTPLPHLRVLSVSARVHSSSPSSRSQRLCESPLLFPIFASSASLRESTPLPHLRVLSAFARVHSSSLSSRSQRLCESPLLFPIFASSAPLRESIPKPHLCVPCASARVHSQYVPIHLNLPKQAEAPLVGQPSRLTPCFNEAAVTSGNPLSLWPACAGTADRERPGEGCAAIQVDLNSVKGQIRHQAIYLQQ